MSRKRKYMHGKRRRRSPLKGIWDTATPSIVKSEKDVISDSNTYMANQEKKGYGQTEFSRNFVNAVVPDSASEALMMIGGGGLLKSGQRGYQTLKAAKIMKSGIGN
tara:strand:- start:103 stop:420 length:318 start_codon:yes stop_codon:yes gene_type:complete